MGAVDAVTLGRAHPGTQTIGDCHITVAGPLAGGLGGAGSGHAIQGDVQLPIALHLHLGGTGVGDAHRAGLEAETARQPVDHHRRQGRGLAVVADAQLIGDEIAHLDRAAGAGLVDGERGSEHRLGRVEAGLGREGLAAGLSALLAGEGGGVEEAMARAVAGCLAAVVGGAALEGHAHTERHAVHIGGTDGQRLLGGQRPLPASPCSTSTRTRDSRRRHVQGLVVAQDGGADDLHIAVEGRSVDEVVDAGDAALVADGEGVGHVILVGGAGHEASSALDGLGQLQRGRDVLQFHAALGEFTVGQRQDVVLQRAAGTYPFADAIAAGQVGYLQLEHAGFYLARGHGCRLRDAGDGVIGVGDVGGRQGDVFLRGRAAVFVHHVHVQRQAHRLVDVFDGAGDVLAAADGEHAVGQMSAVARPWRGTILGQGIGAQGVGTWQHADSRDAGGTALSVQRCRTLR